jgi:D-alanyl-D-alanine carboxypeptidase
MKATELASVTAKSWAIFDAVTGELISGKNEHEQREVASITKIMTCWASI